MGTEIFRSCRACKINKSLSDFYKDSSKAEGLSYRCKECTNKANRESYKRNKSKVLDRCKRYREDNPEKQREIARNYYKKNPDRRKSASKRYTQAHPDRRKDTMLRHVYGISLEEFALKLETQNNKCAICGNECPSGKNLSVDHNHKTGKIRGLLCQTCNRRLEAIEDSGYLNAALRYLEAYDE